MSMLGFHQIHGRIENQGGGESTEAREFIGGTIAVRIQVSNPALTVSRCSLNKAVRAWSSAISSAIDRVQFGNPLSGPSSALGSGSHAPHPEAQHPYVPGHSGDRPRRYTRGSAPLALGVSSGRTSYVTVRSAASSQRRRSRDRSYPRSCPSRCFPAPKWTHVLCHTAPKSRSSHSSLIHHA